MKPTVRISRDTDFYIMWKVRKALENAGQEQYAKEFLQRAANTPSRQLMDLAKEYVEVYV
jgi:hypothetical protein